MAPGAVLAQPNYHSPKQLLGSGYERARARDLSSRQSACGFLCLDGERISCYGCRRFPGARQQSWESFTCYHRRSQEACLFCKPRAAFGSRLAGHASSVSVCMGSGKARTCMTLHVPGRRAALICCKAHPKRSPTSSYAQGKTIPGCFKVGRTQPKAWDRQSHRWGMQNVCPG